MRRRTTFVEKETEKITDTEKKEKNIKEKKEKKEKPNKTVEGFKPKKKKRKWPFVLLGILILIGAVVFFLVSRANAAKMAMESIPKEVTIPLMKSDIKSTVDTSGFVRSEKTVQIYAPGAYKITEVLVKKGDTIKEGDVLAILDTTDIEREIKTAELNLESAKITQKTQAKSTRSSKTSSANSAKSSRQDLETARKAYEKEKAKYDAQVSGNDNYVDEVDQSGNIERAAAAAVAVRQAKLELEVAQRAFDKAVAESSNSTQILTARNDLENAQRAFEQAQSGYSTSNAVKSAQMELDAAKQRQYDTMRSGEVSVNNARIDYDSANRALNEAQNLPVPSPGIEDLRQGKIDAASDALVKARNALDVAIMNRDSANVTAQRAVESAQIALDNAIKASENTKDTTADTLERARLAYENALKNGEEAVRNAQDALTRAQMTYNNALQAQKDSLESAQTSLEKAELAYKSALAASAAIVDSSEGAEISVELQEIALEKLKLLLRDSEIRATSSGTITSMNATIGQPATGLMFTIEDTDHLIIDATVGEFDIGALKVGQFVEISTESVGEERLTGKVTSIASAAKKAEAGGSNGNANITFEVEIKIDQTDPRVRIGMNAQTFITTNEKLGVFVVPTECVINEVNRSYIQVKEGDNIREIDVTIGIESDTTLEISSDQLVEGMQVVQPMSMGSMDPGAMMGGTVSVGMIGSFLR